MEKLLKKIRYRLVWNRSGRLNKRGEGLVQVELEQNKRRIYISTHTYVADGMWEGGMVSRRHPLAVGLNAALLHMKIECERIELDYIRRGVFPTLHMIREAISENMAPGAKLGDFIRSMMKTGTRKEHTQLSYITLLNGIEDWRKGLYVSDIDYQTVARYEKHLQDRGLAHNTIVGRLRMWRAVMNEAVRRKVIDNNPFRRLPDRTHGGAARVSYAEAA